MKKILNIDKKLKEKPIYKLSPDKRGLLRYYHNIGGERNYYHIHSDELTEVERYIKTNLLIQEKQSEFLLKEHIRIIKDFKKSFFNNNNNELKYYKWGFECPNIDNLKTKEEKEIMYNKILNQFQEQLKEWIYK